MHYHKIVIQARNKAEAIMGSSTEEGQCSHGSTGEEEEVQEAEHYCNAMQLVASSLLPMAMQTAIELAFFISLPKIVRPLPQK